MCSGDSYNEVNREVECSLTVRILDGVEHYHADEDEDPGKQSSVCGKPCSRGDWYNRRQSKKTLMAAGALGKGVEEDKNREAAGKTMVALCGQLERPVCCFCWGSCGLISIRVTDLTHMSAFGNQQLETW